MYCSICSSTRSPGLIHLRNSRPWVSTPTGLSERIRRLSNLSFFIYSNLTLFVSKFFKCAAVSHRNEEVASALRSTTPGKDPAISKKSTFHQPGPPRTLPSELGALLPFLQAFLRSRTQNQCVQEAADSNGHER